MKIIFICGPYTASSRLGITRHIREAELLARELARIELGFLCPHLNSRHMQDVRVDPQFWYEMYLNMLEVTDALLTFGNWQKSAGCQGEVARAERLKIPVFHGSKEQRIPNDLLIWAGRKKR